MNGVGHLKLGELDVTFSFPPVLVPRRNAELPANQSLGGETPADTGERQVAGEESPELTDEDKELLEDLRRAQLMVDNPVDYEQELIDSLQ